VGCTSDLKGNVGVLQYLPTADLSAINNQEFAPYVVLVDPTIFRHCQLTFLTLSIFWLVNISSGSADP
jgi:hypothetical protein